MQFCYCSNIAVIMNKIPISLTGESKGEKSNQSYRVIPMRANACSCLSVSNTTELLAGIKFYQCQNNDTQYSSQE